MSGPQKIRLLAYKPTNHWSVAIVEHDRITVPNGDIALRGPLEAYAVHPDCPWQPGLWLLNADAYTGGRNVRLAITKKVQLTPGLDEIPDFPEPATSVLKELLTERNTSD